MSDAIVRYMLPDDRQVLDGFGKLDKVAKDFLYVWTHWKNWEKNPPIVAEVDGNVVGFHAMSFTKSGYINSAFIFILSDYRGKGIGGKLIDYTIKEGLAHKSTRLRMRCYKGNDGDAFWRGFGMVPIGETEKEYFYDLAIDGVLKVEDLIRKAPKLCSSKPTDKRILGFYKKTGLKYYTTAVRLVVDNTPIEPYAVDGVEVWVKREDMCSPYPGPQFSKIRGVERYINTLPKDITVGVVDTQHSKAGWGVSWICKELGLSCIDFYPVLKADKGLKENQQMAQSFGAKLVPMKAGMSAVIFNQAKAILRKDYPNSVMLPNGLCLQESVDATADELVLHTPKKLIRGTWVVSGSSGTLTAGVIKGLYKAGFNGKVICHMGYTRSHDRLYAYLSKMADFQGNVELVDEGYEYKDSVDNSWIPFPCNAYYDAKAFTWLYDNVKKLKQPVVFWNIGA